MAAFQALGSGCEQLPHGLLAGPAATSWSQLPARGFRVVVEIQEGKTTIIEGCITATPKESPNPPNPSVSDALGSPLPHAHLHKRPPLEQGAHGLGVTPPEGQCLLLKNTLEAVSLTDSRASRVPPALWSRRPTHKPSATTILLPHPPTTAWPL
ncbi:hypothetical protein H8959_020063 [Pygathrix nigripes]